MSKKKAITLAIVVLSVCLVVLLWILAYLPPFSFWSAMCITDRIEIKGPASWGYPSKIVVTGEEAKKAARSLRFACCIGNPSCLSELQVRFYQGTNLLTEAGICVKALQIKGKWYEPGTNGKSVMLSWRDRLMQTGPQQQKAVEQ